jgi:formate-dependent nitrite reductase membrane component NrfD
MALLQSPHWPFLIDIYFFLGGLAGGAFVIATVATLFNPRENRDVARVGYYLALLALIPCPIILIVDLGVPSRFLNMLGRFNPQSPMSMGAWALLGFSAAAGLAALFTLLEDMGRARDLGTPKVLVGLIGGFFAFFLAAYPGVLLGATARPLWIEGRALGALFLAVGASSAAAAIVLILLLLRSRPQLLVARLNVVILCTLVLQILAVAIFVLSVRASGSAAALQALNTLLSGSYGLTFWLGAVVVGALLPLGLGLLSLRRQSVGAVALASVLVLIGGFVAKTVIMAAGQV